jgi:pimeloyl-ACP methyl ester carboxylesterase
VPFSLPIPARDGFWRATHESPGALAGLILIGSTHPRDFDLPAIPIPVTKILGLRDGIAPAAEARRNAHLLPPSTAWVEIDGANHVQLGYYRHQLGDDAPAIPGSCQQALLLAAVLRALER